MFHGFDYPDEMGKNELWSRFWWPVMDNGIITFARPDDEEHIRRRFVRKMIPDPPSSLGLREEGLDS